VFWLMERTDQRAPVRRTWSVDLLPTPPVKGAPPFSEMIVSVAFLVLLAIAVVGQQFVSGFVDGSGQAIPILDPTISGWAVPSFLALIAAEIVFAIWLWRAARWTAARAIVNAVLAIVSAGLVVTLTLGSGLFNPEWFAQFGAGDEVDPLSVANIVTCVTAIGVGSWHIVAGAIKAARASRTLAR
ncbi:MAG: hypothetical protein RI885_2586, partial [Actinomycetota bacterium]